MKTNEMGEEERLLSDSVMCDGYKIFKKFLDHSEDLTEEDKRKLTELGVKL